MLITLVVVFVVSYLAFALSAICGGGAGLILLPVLGKLLPVSQVPAGLTIGTFSSAVSRIVLFRRCISWKMVRIFVPAAIPAVWLGAWLLKFVNPFYIEMVTGLFLVSNLVFLVRKRTMVDQTAEPESWLLVAIGFLTGLLSGLTGAVGLVFNRFYLRYNLSRQQIVATRAANEVVLHLIKLVLYASFGLVSADVIQIGLTVALAGLLSSFTMKYVLPLISENLFRKVGYTAMVASGVMMMVQAGNTLLVQKKARLSTAFIRNGAAARVQWQHAAVALEFTYNEGFELEQVVPLGTLSAAQQQKVVALQNGADQLVIEAVYSFAGKSYEAYYYQKGRLVNKVDFN